VAVAYGLSVVDQEITKPRSTLLLFVSLGWLAAGCSSEQTELSFPDGFLFGTAVAGFQGDMGCPTEAADSCEDRSSDWYQWVTSSEIINEKGMHQSAEPPSDGPGHWELYAQDYALVRDKLGANAFRLSIEWSRIFPGSTVGVSGHEALKKVASAAALKRYHQMFAELKRLGIRPLVTLNHYTLPLWIHDGVACHKDLSTCTKRGWLDAKLILAEIAKYAAFVAREFGGEVDYWITLNEPFAVVLPGYLMPSDVRVNPPGLTLRTKEARAVLVTMIEAHARMYDALQGADKLDADGDGAATRIGIAYSVAPTAPRDPADPLDVSGAQDLSYLLNEVFFEAICAGKLDRGLNRKPEARPDLARLDFIGINYYETVTVDGVATAPFPSLSPLFTVNPFTLTHTANAPRGIYDSLKLLQKYNKPVIITENGNVDPSDDGSTSTYLVRHLFWLQRAMDEGIEVEGYLYWSFVDNYEWNHGFGMRFGLFGIDTKDPQKKRVPRRGVATFREIATRGRLSRELLEANLTAEERQLLPWF
jgi:beta-galactosidase